MSQSNPPNQTSGKGKGRGGTAAIIGLALVALLSLGFAAYTASNEHAATVTQQIMVTNTESFYSVQTETMITANTVTSVTTATNQPSGYGYGNYQYCGYYVCSQSPGYYYPGYYYGYYNGYWGYAPPCQPTGSNGAVTCSGYLYQAQNGCNLLVVSTTSNPYPSYATGLVNEYYTLHNLPSNTPQLGSLVTVTGQLYQGYNTAPNGASCPNNYIIVSTIT